MVFDSSAMRCVASAMGEIAVELQHDEQLHHESMLGELSYLLSGVRQELRNWEEKRRQVFIKHEPESSASVCREERELCGFVHDRFIVDCDSVPLMCFELGFKERSTFARRIDVDVDDGDDMMVTITSRTVTWVHLSGLKVPEKWLRERIVREVRERRDLGIRLHLDLSGGEGPDEGHEVEEAGDVPGWQVLRQN